MTYALEQAARRETGLAPHYPFLHQLVVELEAAATFEFGAGRSTRVFLDAHNVGAGGRHFSCSGETREAIRAATGLTESVDWRWEHVCGDSTRDVAAVLCRERPHFDVVLHDGSHSAEVVSADLALILPYVKTYGLILVHDTMHSYVGRQVREGVHRFTDAHRAVVEMVTLPFAFGLTIIQVTVGLRPWAVGRRRKMGSTHVTEPHLP